MISNTLRRFAATFALMAVAACLFAGLPQIADAQIPFNGQQVSIFQNYPVATVTTLTATAQTSASFGMPGSSTALIQVKATSLTTVTWALQCSIDGGTTFFPINTASLTTYPTTIPITTLVATETSTATGLYVANVGGFTNCRFVTSGTFTATGLVIKLVTTSNRGLL